MVKKTFLFLSLMIAISVHSQELKQNTNETKVTFKIKNFGVSVEGKLADVTIQTNFNSQRISESYINSTINVKSISTGISGRDKSLLKKAYFDEANYKSIRLTSTKIEKQSNGKYKLFGELTIKKTTKKIEVPLEVSETGNSLTIKSIFTIDRKDYKVGGNSLVMGKKVKIEVVYSGTK